MNIKRKNAVLLVLAFLMLLSFVGTSLVSVVYAEEDYEINRAEDEEKENIVLRTIGGAFRWIAKALYSLLGDASIDSLVFNQDSDFSGLTLFKGGKAQDFLAKFYNLFNYIAVAFFIPMVYWFGMTFVKAGDNPHGKSELKERFMKIILTFVLLYSMPQLLTILVRVSNGFTQTFAGIADSSSPVGDYISDTLKENETFIGGLTSLILVGFNLWFVFYYITRDLTIIFLFMFFPIVAIWYPYNDNLVKSWWQNMAGNVFSQPIQAIILTMLITLSNTLGVSDFLTGVYLIVAFGSIIPMTGIIKGFLGLEGSIGAASSRAGVGGVMAASHLVRHAGQGLKNNVGEIAEGTKTLKGNHLASKELDKNLEPQGSGVSRVDELDKELINPTPQKLNHNSSSYVSSGSGEITEESLKASNRQAYKQIGKGVGGIAGGAFGGVSGGAIGLGATGSFAGAGIGAMGGGSLGSATGGGLSSGATDIAIGAKENYQMENKIDNLHQEEIQSAFMEANPGYEGDILEEDLASFRENNPEIVKSTRNTAEEKYLDIYDQNLSGTEFQNNRRDSMMAEKTVSNAMTNPLFNYRSQLAAVNRRSTEYSAEDISKMDNVSFYQDQDSSYLYTKNDDNSVKEVLKSGAGNPNISEPINREVSFDSQDYSIAEDVSLGINESAAVQATEYMRTAYPDMTANQSEYQGLYSEKYNEYSRPQASEYKENLDIARNSVNMPNMNIKTDQAMKEQLAQQSKDRRKKFAEEEYQRQMAKVIDKEKELRNQGLKDSNNDWDRQLDGQLNVNDVI